MNILFISQYYYPEQFQINEIAPELVKRGHEVTVLTGLPNYPEGVVLNDYRHEKKREEIVDGVRVIRCAEFGRKKGKLNLLLNYLSFSFFGSHKAKKLGESFDAVLCYQLSPVTMAAPAVAYKKKYGVPLLLYCLDIWPESAQAHVHNDKGFIYKKIAAYSKAIYSQCDRIAVTSRPFIEYMRDINSVPEERLSYIPQHANGEMLDMALGNEKTGIAEFMYAGNLGKGQRVDIIIKAAALLKDRDDFKVNIVGDGSVKDELEKLSHELGADGKVIFHGQKKRSEMPELYRKTDALLITLRGNNFVGNTMPGKLQMYMSAGKPVLGSINGAAAQVIEESGCGKCVPAEDCEGLSRIMADFLDNRETYSDCGEKARDYFKKHFTLDIFMDSLEKELSEMKNK